MSSRRLRWGTHGTRSAGPPVRRSSLGFTLAELLVALAVAGVVLVLAHALFTGVTAAAERAASGMAETTRDANRHLWLVRTFGSAVVGSQPMRGFRGLDRWRDALETDELAFAAVVRTAAGHEERLVSLGLDRRRRLVAELRLPPGPRDARPDTLVLADELLGFGAEYLLEYGAGARWVREFVSPVSAPVAARLRLDRGPDGVDTLLVHIGVRG